MIRFKRNPEGLQKVLNSPETLAALRSYADPIADEIRTRKPDAEVVVDEYTATAKGRFTERHAVSVGVLDVRARVWQARDGLLTSAAASHGLEVSARDRVD